MGFIPVEGDPFAAAPSAAPKFTPVDADPFKDTGAGALWNTSKIVGSRLAEGAAHTLNLPRDLVGETVGKGAGILDALKADFGDDLAQARVSYKYAKEDANRRYMLNLFGTSDERRAKAQARMAELEAKYGKDVLERTAENATRKFIDKNFDVRNSMRAVGIEPAKTSQEAADRLGVENTPLRGILGDVAKTTGEVASLPVGGGIRGLAGNLVTGAAMGTGEVADKGLGVSEGVGLPPGFLGSLAMGFAPAVVTGAVKQAANIAAPVVNRQGLADRAIFEAMGNKPLTSLPANPLPGAPLTLGERTGNVGANRLQIALRGDPKVQAAGMDFEASARATGAKAADEMGALAGAKTERQASEALRKEMTSTYQSEKAMVTPDIEKVKASLPKIATPATRLDNHIGRYVDTLTAERQAWLRDAGLGRLEQVAAQPGRVRLNEVDDILSTMKGKAREMPAGDARRVEIERFIGHMQKGMEAVVPGMKPAYKQYAGFKADFDANPLIGKLFERNADRTFKIPPSEVGDALRRLPAEAIERAAKVSPGVKAAGKDWLSAAWKEATTKIAGDTASHAAARNFFRDNEAFFKAFYTPAEFARSQNILKALEMREAPKTATGITRLGSPTFEKIQNATYLDGLSGKVLSHLPGGSKLMDFLFQKSSEEIRRKMAEALLNPDATFARLLNMKPTPNTTALLKQFWARPAARVVYGAAQTDQ